MMASLENIHEGISKCIDSENMKKISFAKKAFHVVRLKSSRVHDVKDRVNFTVDCKN